MLWISTSLCLKAAGDHEKKDSETSDMELYPVREELMGASSLRSDAFSFADRSRKIRSEIWSRMMSMSSGKN